MSKFYEKSLTFSAVHDKYDSFVSAIAMRILKNESKAEDSSFNFWQKTQQEFMNHSNPNDLDKYLDKGFIGTCAKRFFINESNKKDERLDVFYFPNTFSDSSDSKEYKAVYQQIQCKYEDINVHDRLEYVEMFDLIQKKVLKKYDDQILFDLKTEKITEEEIAIEMNLSEEYIKTKWRRLKLKIKKLLSSHKEYHHLRTYFK